ncbi:MAG: cupin domain-containing protein [Acidimicrobiia bacterium]|nr:cupin domain-containing protein [Acidimicrobiia bacterium]
MVWSLPRGGDLDANLVRLGGGGAIATHANHEADVLIFVQSGNGELVVDDRVHELRGDAIALVPRGASRELRAGPRGITYLTVHRHRDGLTIVGPRRGSSSC